MKTPLQRIRSGAGILAGVSCVSIVGYILITPGGQLSNPAHWLDAIDWFIFTVSTVGYTEHSSAPSEFKAFRIIVIVIGITAAGYTLGGLIQMMTEGEIERAMGLRRMSREISQLSGHVIVCGFGRIGNILAEALTSQKRPFVVIDDEADRIAEAEHLNYLVVSGDATEESVLEAAGLERAEIFISALGSDAGNVFLTLTAHTLNPDVRIIARGESPRSENKLRHASLAQIAGPAIRQLVHIHRTRHRLAAAFVAATARDLGHRERVAQFREEVVRRFGALLLERRSEINHPHPERAVEFIIKMVLSGARQEAIFGKTEAAGHVLSEAEMASELERMFLGYLGASA
jgi:Trk K+ transport system NAD-binding subunit